jgi:hypothetical protein
VLYAAPGQSFEVTFAGVPTGLVGTFGVRIQDGVGGTTTARSVAGIVETPAGSGIYVATLAAPAAAGHYVLVGDTGGGAPAFFAEDLVVTYSAPGFVPATGWSPLYATLAELKASVGILDADDDTELGYALGAASRLIDDYTGRQFGALAVAIPRYYEAFYDIESRRWMARIDDLMVTTDLVVKTDDGTETYPTTLAADTDFRLQPYNAPADGRPWTTIVASTSNTFSRDLRSLQVTARWGWAAVPAVVTQACLIQAGRLFKRKDAPFGVAGSPELGSELRLLDRVDPDVAVLLSGLRRRRLLV